MEKDCKNILFYVYFEKWIKLYKVGAIKQVTLNKYYLTLRKVEEIAPKLFIGDLTRSTYQDIINKYSETHERQTTMDFHHQLKGSVLDAFDDGLIAANPLRKIVIKGKLPCKKKCKFLSQFELQSLIKQLDCTTTINWDWFILLISKTGLRFSEALALTTNDFDFQHQIININKSWNYKILEGCFQETKNLSSVRKVRIDWKTAMQFSQLLSTLGADELIFIKSRVFNSTINNRLKVLCKRADIPIISIHGLRHTHASLLLYANVSIASVAKRLGHSSMTTTQETYLHIIQELESQDNDKIMMHLSSIL